MAQYDLPLDQLRVYTPDLPVPDDFEEFWSRTLADAAARDLAVSFTPVDSGLAVIETYDTVFAGFGGAPIRAWLHLPTGRSGRLPAVVEYVGYGGGRGLPHERTFWAAAGYAHLVMDTRGQGSSWSIGETPDVDPAGGHPGTSGANGAEGGAGAPAGPWAPAHPGFMTRGIQSPDTYYYRRVFTDAVRAVAAVRTHPAVDPEQVAVTGGSQGGGITLAVAGLVGDLSAAMPDVPFLCDFRRSTTLVDSDPYGEIARYLRAHRDHVDSAFRTLSYFDGAILGRRAGAPALFSVALMDDICPPSTVYAAYNHYAGPKEIREYQFNRHEGGEGFHDVAKLRWLAGVLRRAGSAAVAAEPSASAPA